MSTEQQGELLDIQHTPIAPPRQATPGEGIFLQLWVDYLAADPGRLEGIFRDLNFRTDQRAASVAAAFMVFMGCNGGAGFTFTAEQFARSDIFMSRERAFLAAWSCSNARRHGINYGLRTCEYMLAPKHPVVTGGCWRDVDYRLVPEISMRDMDVIEAMVAWWSSADAGRMREIATPMIEAANKRIWSEMFTRTETQP